jgi:hypothetical protein
MQNRWTTKKPHLMTQNEKAIYDYILSFKERHDGVSPSFRDIAENAPGAPYSTSYISWSLKNLQKLGAISVLADGKNRAIQVVGGRWVRPDVIPAMVG